MFSALSKIKELPDDVLFYPGHEYTMPAAMTAYNFNRGNPEIRQYLERAKERIEQGLPVGPVPLGIEKKMQPLSSGRLSSGTERNRSDLN